MSLSQMKQGRRWRDGGRDGYITKGRKQNLLEEIKHKNNVKEVNYRVSDRESRNANESMPIRSVPIYWSAV